MNPTPDTPAEQQPDCEAIVESLTTERERNILDLGFSVRPEIFSPKNLGGHLLHRLRNSPAALAKFLQGSDYIERKSVDRICAAIGRGYEATIRQKDARIRELKDALIIMSRDLNSVLMVSICTTSKMAMKAAIKNCAMLLASGEKEQGV